MIVKKSILLLLVIVCLSCSDDDDEGINSLEGLSEQELEAIEWANLRGTEIDGDTYSLIRYQDLLENTVDPESIRVRLAWVDCPENDPPFGEEA